VRDVEVNGFKVQRYGRGHKDLDNTITGLVDYRYSIVVENTDQDFYFTDKLLLCFTVGTVPIFWGMPSIGSFFDTAGMILFHQASELPDILKKLSVEDYETRRPAMLRNLETVKKYWAWEDVIYTRHRWLFENPVDAPPEAEVWWRTLGWPGPAGPRNTTT